MDEEDDWGVAARKNRKRKSWEIESVFSALSLHDESPAIQRTVTEEGIQFRNLYDAVRGGGDFLEVLMEFGMKDADLRKVARVSKEWKHSSYKIIRERIGNCPFLLLWRAELSFNLDFSEHFHSAYLQRDRLSVSYPATPIVGSEKYGHINNKSKLESVETIICFANVYMMDQFDDFIQEHSWACVTNFVFICGFAVFFTTPDLKNVGDSEYGIYKERVESPTPMEVGCNYMASLLFPKSPHFKLHLETDIIPKVTQISDGLVTKVIILFKYFEQLCPKLKKLIRDKLNNSFRLGSKNIHIITGDYLLVNSNTGSVEPVLSVCGDQHTIPFIIEISEGEMDKMDWMLQQYSTHFQPSTSFCFFAMLFFGPGLTRRNHNSNVPKFTSKARFILEKLHKYFPHIPIQGISSDREIRSSFHISPYINGSATAVAAMDDLYSTNSLSSEHPDKPKLMVILVIKYPKTVKPANTTTTATATPSQNSMELD